MLELSTPLVLSAARRAAAVALFTPADRAAGLDAPGTIAIISGWGDTTEGGNLPDVLQLLVIEGAGGPLLAASRAGAPAARAQAPPVSTPRCPTSTTSSCPTFSKRALARRHASYESTGASWPGVLAAVPCPGTSLPAAQDQPWPAQLMPWRSSSQSRSSSTASYAGD